MNIKDFSNINNIFFIGIGGTGMSALAQYLVETGKDIRGSDRQFVIQNISNIRNKLEKMKIKCFPQNGDGINSETDLVIVSTAVEKTNIEYVKAEKLNIPIIMRSDLLKLITDTKKTIAISGTSGKSTTVAMLFHILQKAKLYPSLITGAGLIDLQKGGREGNAFVGKGEWLIIEADESDGSLVKYKPEIGVILNIEKDHKELSELMQIFKIFKNNVKNRLIVNRNCVRSKELSENIKFDFGINRKCMYNGKNFEQNGFSISFHVNNIKFNIPIIGIHNMENAMAAISVASYLNIDLQTISKALESYKGIYRRHQIIGTHNDITVIDDYAHNPVKVANSIKACINMSDRLIAWFQPHGFVPTKFLRNEFVDEISNTLRDNDQIWMSEIYYAGGTVNKDISAKDLINDIKKKNKKAFFVEDRNNFFNILNNKLVKGDIILIMGARDFSLNEFAQSIFNSLKVHS